MKRILLCLIAGALSLAAAGQQQQKEYDPIEAAEVEAQRLTDLLKLEYWQTFYVDSTLQHDLTEMYEEYKKLQHEKVTSYDLYLAVQDKWTDKIEASYQKYFTEEQWKKYLKSGADRARKQREKRQQERK